MMIDSTRAYAKLVAAFNQNDWLRVQQRAAQILPVAPDDAGLHFMLGVACLQTRQIPRALTELLKASQLDPLRADCIVEYARALTLCRRLREARFAADRAMPLAANDPALLDKLGMIYIQAKAAVPAATAFRRAATLMPENAAFRFNLAQALAALGDIDGAQRELEMCVQLEPRQWQAHLHLAQLQRRAGTGNHIARLQKLLDQYDRDLVAQIYLNTALADELECAADYPAAFTHYARGNAAVRRVRPYDFRRDEAMFKALISASPALHTPPISEDVANAPIFIIGLPHTGTTLLERILSNHPEVYAAGELPNFPMLLQQASGSRSALFYDPDLITRIRHIDWQRLGKAYLDSTRATTTDKPRLIDGLPHNFLCAGFIARALPNARIICLRRDPLDSCISNFRHLFEREAADFDYSYNLLDTGRYYIQFDRLMRHWREVLPGRMLDISCESLVHTPKTSTRRLLSFCGLPWNDACLQTSQQQPATGTSSMSPISLPIHHTPIGHWRHYAAQLHDLRNLLIDAGIPLQD